MLGHRINRQLCLPLPRASNGECSLCGVRTLSSQQLAAVTGPSAAPVFLQVPTVASPQSSPMQKVRGLPERISSFLRSQTSLGREARGEEVEGELEGLLRESVGGASSMHPENAALAAKQLACLSLPLPRRRDLSRLRVKACTALLMHCIPHFTKLTEAGARHVIRAVAFLPSGAGKTPAVFSQTVCRDILSREAAAPHSSVVVGEALALFGRKGMMSRKEALLLWEMLRSRVAPDSLFDFPLDMKCRLSLALAHLRIGDSLFWSDLRNHLERRFVSEEGVWVESLAFVSTATSIFGVNEMEKLHTRMASYVSERKKKYGTLGASHGRDLACLLRGFTRRSRGEGRLGEALEIVVEEVCPEIETLNFLDLECVLEALRARPRVLLRGFSSLSNNERSTKVEDMVNRLIVRVEGERPGRGLFLILKALVRLESSCRVEMEGEGTVMEWGNGLNRLFETMERKIEEALKSTELDAKQITFLLQACLSERRGRFSSESNISEPPTCDGDGKGDVSVSEGGLGVLWKAALPRVEAGLGLHPSGDAAGQEGASSDETGTRCSESSARDAQMMFKIWDFCALLSALAHSNVAPPSRLEEREEGALNSRLTKRTTQGGADGGGTEARRVLRLCLESLAERVKHATKVPAAAGTLEESSSSPGPALVWSDQDITWTLKAICTSVWVSSLAPSSSSLSSARKGKREHSGSRRQADGTSMGEALFGKSGGGSLDREDEEKEKEEEGETERIFKAARKICKGLAEALSERHVSMDRLHALGAFRWLLSLPPSVASVDVRSRGASLLRLSLGSSLDLLGRGCGGDGRHVVRLSGLELSAAALCLQEAAKTNSDSRVASDLATMIPPLTSQIESLARHLPPRSYQKEPVGRCTRNSSPSTQQNPFVPPHLPQSRGRDTGSATMEEEKEKEKETEENAPSLEILEQAARQLLTAAASLGAPHPPLAGLSQWLFLFRLLPAPLRVPGQTLSGSLKESGRVSAPSSEEPSHSGGPLKQRGASAAVVNQKDVLVHAVELVFALSRLGLLPFEPSEEREKENAEEFEQEEGRGGKGCDGEALSDRGGSKLPPWSEMSRSSEPLWFFSLQSMTAGRKIKRDTEMTGRGHRGVSVGGAELRMSASLAFAASLSFLSQSCERGRQEHRCLMDRIFVRCVEPAAVQLQRFGPGDGRAEIINLLESGDSAPEIQTSCSQVFTAALCWWLFIVKGRGTVVNADGGAETVSLAGLRSLDELELLARATSVAQEVVRYREEGMKALGRQRGTEISRAEEEVLEALEDTLVGVIRQEGGELRRCAVVPQGRVPPYSVDFLIV